MKKFKFSLEAALKWKRTQEEEALKQMGMAMRWRQECFNTLEISRRQFGELLKSVRQARSERMEIWTQVIYTREVARQEGVCKKSEELLQKAILQEEAARHAYLQKRREAETIEKLKEKRKETYQLETDRAIERELEEIMLSKANNELANVLCSN